MATRVTVGTTANSGESSATYASLTIPLVVSAPAILFRVRYEARAAGVYFLDLDGTEVASATATGPGVVLTFDLTGSTLAIGTNYSLRIRMRTPARAPYVSGSTLVAAPFTTSRAPEMAAGFTVPLEFTYEDPRTYKIWADIGSPGATQAGTQVGTQVGAGTTASLFWYLGKAGIVVKKTPAPPGTLEADQVYIGDTLIWDR